MIKKLSIFFAVAAVALGFTGCKDDDDPVYQEPTDATEFKLNVPAFANQLYQLTENGVMTLTCETQPDYGFLASVQYSAEISLDKTNVAPVTPDKRTSTVMEIKESAIATAMCTLAGITDLDQWNANTTAQGPQLLYVRAVAQLSGVESSRVVSDWVELKQVQGYFAIPSPGFIYLIGAASGWNAPSPENAEVLKDWRLWESETAIGSGIYSGVFTIPAGQAMFRFYTELTKAGWDNATASLGAREANDDNEDITLNDGAYQGSYVLGKGNWNIPDWTEDGQLTIIVNTVEKTVQFIAGAQQVYTPRYVYMVGNNAGWADPLPSNEATYEPWRLADLTESGIYSATFDFPAEGFGNDKNPDLFCRFYKELAGWVDAEWASTTGSDFPVTSGVAVSTAVGQGCFQMVGAAGKKVTVTLDTTVDPATVKFEFVD